MLLKPDVVCNSDDDPKSSERSNAFKSDCELPPSATLEKVVFVAVPSASFVSSSPPKLFTSDPTFWALFVSPIRFEARSLLSESGYWKLRFDVALDGINLSEYPVSESIETLARVSRFDPDGVVQAEWLPYVFGEKEFICPGLPEDEDEDRSGVKKADLVLLAFDSSLLSKLPLLEKMVKFRLFLPRRIPGGDMTDKFWWFCCRRDEYSESSLNLEGDGG